MSATYMKYGEKRRARVSVEPGELLVADGTIVITESGTIETDQVWTKYTTRADGWAHVAYIPGSWQPHPPKPPKPVRPPWYKRWFGLGPKVPTARVVKR